VLGRDTYYYIRKERLNDIMKMKFMCVRNNKKIKKKVNIPRLQLLVQLTKKSYIILSQPFSLPIKQQIKYHSLSLSLSLSLFRFFSLSLSQRNRTPTNPPTHTAPNKTHFLPLFQNRFLILSLSLSLSLFSISMKLSLSLFPFSSLLTTSSSPF